MTEPAEFGRTAIIGMLLSGVVTVAVAVLVTSLLIPMTNGVWTVLGAVAVGLVVGGSVGTLIWLFVVGILIQKAGETIVTGGPPRRGRGR